MSKTQRQREGGHADPALSKNHGANIKYRKRLVEDQEAQEERERALQELADMHQELFPEEYIKRPV